MFDIYTKVTQIIRTFSCSMKIAPNKTVKREKINIFYYLDKIICPNDVHRKSFVTPKKKKNNNNHLQLCKN